MLGKDNVIAILLSVELTLLWIQFMFILTLDPYEIILFSMYPALLDSKSLILLMYYGPLPWMFYYDGCVDSYSESSYAILLFYYNWYW